MTVVSFLSVKGAPGVTTLTCLVGASWPVARPVIVAEADPWGGDLAPRFGLSSKSGWSSLATSARRGDGTGGGVGPHLQQLPGGLDVLVGTDGGPDAARHRSWELLAPFADGHTDAPLPDILVDLGRWAPGDPGGAAWLRRSEHVVLVTWAEVASVLRVRQLADELTGLVGAPPGLAVVTYGPLARGEIEQFTGLPVLGELPFDPAAAAVASGRAGGVRRLSRSQLAAGAERLAGLLAVPVTPEQAVDSRAVGGEAGLEVVPEPDHGTGPAEPGSPRRVPDHPVRQLVGSRLIGRLP